MKFPTECSIAIVKGDEVASKKGYLNSLRKVKPQNVNIVLVDTEMLNAPGEGSALEQWGDIEMVDAPVG